MLKKILMINILVLISFNVCYATNVEQFVKNEINNEEINNFLTEESDVYSKSGLIYVGFAICSDSSTDFEAEKSSLQESFGHHSWLAITNFGTTPININGIEIPVFDTITIGAWNGIIHSGIFYNIERYYAEKGEFSIEKSAYKIIFLNDFELNYLISLLSDSTNDMWSITNNCSYFAEKIWNKIADTRISAGIIKSPIKLHENILIAGGRKGLFISSPDTELYYGGKNPTKFDL